MQQPMDCEERLLNQARMTKSMNNETNVFVYRNLVKALPWFSTVREKILDPAYAGWFTRFSGKDDYHVPECAAENKSKCSMFYHGTDTHFTQQQQQQQHHQQQQIQIKSRRLLYRHLLTLVQTVSVL